LEACQSLLSGRFRSSGQMTKEQYGHCDTPELGVEKDRKSDEDAL
jgi:hypothetical protein